VVHFGPSEWGKKIKIKIKKNKRVISWVMRLVRNVPMLVGKGIMENQSKN